MDTKDFPENRQKKAEEALKASDARYKAIFDAVNDAIFVIDPQSGAILEVNRKMTEMYGYTADEARNLTVEDVSLGIPPYDREAALGKIMIAIEQGASTFEWRCKHKSGRILTTEVSLRPAVIDGRTCVVAVVRDITDRKRAEDALKKMEETLRRSNEELESKVAERTGSIEHSTRSLAEQKELLQAIIDSIPVIVTFWSPSAKLTLVNKEFERLTGWSQEEAVNTDIIAASFPDPDYRKEVYRRVVKAEPGWGEFVIATRSGGTLTISWAAVRLSGNSRIGIGIDVTEQRKMEKDLLRLGAAIEQTGEGIALADPGGAIEYVNPAFVGITGYSREELIGKTCDSITEYLAGNDMREIFDSVAKEGKTWSGRQIRKRKTGEIIEINLSVSAVCDKPGRIINYVSVIQDVTSEVRMQRQLAQNQKMEAIGSLAGGIAHDLKNILTPIMLNTEMALEDVGEHHPARPVLEEALDAARLGKDLVQQILTFSRRLPQKKSAVNISAVIKETFGFLRSTLPSTIDIRNDLQDECVITYADPTQIKQVLINLGSNAGHAMKEGGILEVSEEKTDLDIEEAAQVSPDLSPGPYVQVTVHDTGYGMDGETMEHIFEPFFTTKKGEGTGMGLAVAHGIVKEHHGAITVQSTPGEGSTFRVLLPVLQDGLEDRECKAGQTS